MQILKKLKNYSGIRLMHFKCINNFYPKTGNKVSRGSVPEKKIPWMEKYPEYAPYEYTSPNILALPPYADPDLKNSNFAPKWNEIDGKINRQSHETSYEIIYGRPRNYKGRTGITGRGCLGRWGPNHSADPIVTRWKLVNNDFVFDAKSKKRILQFVSIERHDCGEWAIPGGMVDPGEKVTVTLQREFMEEALNSLQMSNRQKEEAQIALKSLFSSGSEIYRGYVDDPRNTDNAWMETIAYNFHDDDKEGVLYKLDLVAGDDARAVKWIDLSNNLKLYASHKEMLALVIQKLNAHW